jgi:diaminohydroxyphosphoribosylaminopyrimidine deaminase/5-amino-6-(5-phosphoribosylamino)uracil reductase
MDPAAFTAHMDEAVALARLHHPHPNPRVGAVLVASDGTVVGRGAHERRGTPHAEIHALEQAGELARGATMVVTLEPCSHEGTTPPCTDALIAAGIGSVVVGAVDPDPRVSGRGLDRLREAGIGVVLVDEPVVDVDPGYFHHRTTGRPRLTLKLAATLDGQTAAADGTSQWITSPEARRDAHRLRARSDAVMVGAGTLRTDNPRLDVRLGGYGGPQPRPVVVGGHRPLPADAAVFARSPLVYTPHPIDVPGEVVVVGAEDDGIVALDRVLDDLGRREIVDVLVEGGARLAGALRRQALVDRYVVYLGASVAGGIGRAMFDGEFATLGDREAVQIDDVRSIGPDVRIVAEVIR